MGQLEEHAHLPVLAAVVVCGSDHCQRLASFSHCLDHRTQTAVHTGPIVVSVLFRLVTDSFDANGCPYWSHIMLDPDVAARTMAKLADTEAHKQTSQGR